ncbi:MAG: terminase family protein [Cyanobacteriota bacterium]
MVYLRNLLQAQFINDEKIGSKEMIIKSDKDALFVLQSRSNILKLALSSPEKLKETKDQCANNIIYWLENFCYTFDPRPKSLRNIPFMPYEYQRSLILSLVDCIKNGEDILIEKSRDMGATWCILYVLQWYWQFHSGYNFHLGSKKQDNVDVIGDPSTLFGKIRYNLRLQPSWLLPEGFNIKKNSTLLKLINPANGNTITGESANSEFSRSGRYSAIFFDEFAYWNYDKEAWSAAGDSSPCRIAVSTPFGKFNKFADLRFDSSIKKTTLHWKLHPLKSDDWYKNEKNRRTKDEIARELDISYLFSVEGKVYKDFDYAIHVTKNLKADRVFPVIRTWDFGLNPAVVISQISDKGQWKVLYEIVPPLDNKPTIAEFIPQVLEYCKKNYEGFTFRDICDIAGKQKSSQTGKSDIDWLISYGISPLYNYVKIEEGINLVASRLICKDFIPEPAVLIDDRCSFVVEAFVGAYRRKKPSVEGQETVPLQEHPYEDVMDCIRYTAWQYFDPHTGKKTRRKPRNVRPDNIYTGY